MTDKDLSKMTKEQIMRMLLEQKDKKPVNVIYRMKVWDEYK